MDATQVISNSILESEEEENEEENQNKGRPMAKLCILKNPHIPETELPLFLGDNVLGRDPSTCTLPFPAPSVSKQHATICISVYKRRGCHGDVGMEALVWDLGSMNGTRKGRLKLTPNVRYALSEGDSLVVADIPCQYVSCAADSIFSQDDMRTPGSRNSGVKVRLPDALGEGWGDTSTGSMKYVSGGAKARVSLKRTPVSGSCLSFEQTPTQPQGTLVPQSDSDSDSERGGRGEKRRKALVSDSDSHKSSPSSCPSSAFLSPADKIVPESEDESPITPSSSSRNGSYRHVSFSTEETDLDVGRQQLEKKRAPAILGNCLKEEEREVQGETNSKESQQPVKPEGNVSLTGESPVSTSEASKDAIPAFNMDSDSDVDLEEEEAASAGPLCSNANQQTDQPPNTVHFHMDSDTDVDEDADVSDKAPKRIPSSNDTKPSHVASVIHPEGITMDSDTDVDDDAALSDAAATAKATSFQDAHTADTASSVQLRDFHLDSDTDVDEEVEGNCETVNKNSTKDETPIKLDMKLIVPECAPVAPHSLHLDSDTDDEAVPAPVIGEPSAPAPVTKSCATADAGADLDIMSDSDTDEKDDSPLGVPVAVSNLPACPGTTSEALWSDSDANTDVDESIVSPAGDRVNPADFRLDSDTDVEDKEEEDHIPDLQRENTLRLLVPHQQNCSIPAQISEEEVEEMETQAFISPSSGAFRQPVGLSSCSDSQVDSDFLVAETQSFILQTRDCQTRTDPTKASAVASPGDKIDEQTSRGCSFQLGLSDSSHLQSQGTALAMENTQAFVSVERGVKLEETQAYVAVSTADRTSAENDSNLSATQAYGEDEELAGDSEVSEKEACADFALEATQSYISEHCSDPENDSDEQERQNAAVIETLPSGSPTCSVQAVKTTTQAERREKEDNGKAAQPQHLTEDQSVTETQPLCASDSEEGDDEGSFPGPRKRMAKPLQLEEEQTQPLTCSLAETQPMVFCEDDESDEEDSMLIPRKRKAKRLHLEEEETQQLTNSELSTAETQPMAVSEDEDTDSMPGPRKRKAKPLQFEDETQSLANSEVSAAETQALSECGGEQINKDDTNPCPQKRKAKPLQLEERHTQPLISPEVSGVQTHSELTGEDKKSDDEDSIPGPQKRKAKQLHIEEDETQKLTDSELSTLEVQPVVPCEDKDSMSGQQTQALTTTEVSESQSKVRDEESDDEDSHSRPQKRKTKRVHLEEGETQPLSNSEVCTAETPLKAKTPETSGVSLTKSRETRARLREGEEEPQCCIPPKRRSRMESKTLTSTRGRRGKARSDDDTTEEQMKPVKQTRGRRNARQGVDDDEDNERNPVKEQKDEKLEEIAVAELREQEREAVKERRETAEQERLQAEDAERVKIELERVERENKEKEEREVKERLEREEKERLERERKEQEQKESLETAKREQEERLARERKEQQTRREIEEREKLEKEKHSKESQENEEEKEKPKAPARGRGAAKRTIAAQSTAEPEQDSTPANNDFPASRTRSRSNSSNSVSSEMSIPGVNTQDSKRGGRGRGAKRSSETPKTTTVRSSRRRMTVAAEPTEHSSNDNRAQELLSRPNPENSVSSEISSCSVNTQNRGRGGRQRGRGRKTEPVLGTIAPVVSESHQSSTVRDRRSRRTKGSSSEALHEDEKERADSQQAGTSRGRQRANASGSEPAASNDEGQLNQEEGLADEKSHLPQRNVRGRGQKAVKTETVGPAVSEGDAVRKQRKGRKSQMEANTGVDSAKGEERAQKTQTAEEEIPSAVRVRRTGRSSSTLVKNNAKESFPEEEGEDGEKMEVETPKKKVRGQTSATSMNQDANVEASEPQTPTGVFSRKRHTPAGSSPVAKTPRSSFASPAASGRVRAGGQAYKVLFTGVVDEEGERVLARLGGSMAKGVADMNCLVTDKVRRTVKFLCAVAKGIPVVTTDWLEKSGKAGSFLSPSAFVVTDPEQEKKFSFRLQDSLRTASTQPLLQGYEIHVTKSVKPEPVHMRDIISSSGATFLPKMPSSHKPQTVVISCEEDWRLCGPAVSASLPVVTAEFILTGILQQKLDFRTYVLSPPTATLQPAGGRGRGRRRT